MSNPTNYIFEYHNAIRFGDVVVGKFIKKLYEIIIDGIANKEFFFNPKKANKAIKFIENFCHHCEGRNDLFKLELWQKSAVSVIFGIVEDNGFRLWREVFIIIAKKNGKSLLAAAIVAYMAYLDGEYGAKIYCIAPKLEQAMIIYDNFYQMVESESELYDITRKRRSDIYIEESNTSVKALAFNAKKSEGFNPHLVVGDEVASWRGDGGLKQYETMKSALGARRQPLILTISTAGFFNDSIYDELFKRSTSFLNGDSREKRLLPFLYIIDNPDRWNDIEELKKSNPNLGVSVSEEFYKEELAIAENSNSKKVEVLTKYCNIKQNSSVAWLEYTLLDRCRIDKKLEDFSGCYAVAGIDLSQTTDLTAASVVIEKDNKLYTFAQFFMPRSRIETLQSEDGAPYELFVRQGLITESGENYVDYRDVYNWILNLRLIHDIYVLKIGYDRYSSQYLINDLNGAGYHTDDVFQGENLAGVIREFEGILKDNKFFIANNNLLISHFMNVALKHNLQTRKFRPEKIHTNARIDGFVSVIDALTVRQKYYNEIEVLLKND